MERGELGCNGVCVGRDEEEWGEVVGNGVRWWWWGGGVGWGGVDGGGGVASVGQGGVRWGGVG